MNPGEEAIGSERARGGMGGLIMRWFGNGLGGGMRTYIWNIARKTREQDITGSDFSKMEVLFFCSNRGIRRACKKEIKRHDVVSSLAMITKTTNLFGSKFLFSFLLAAEGQGKTLFYAAPVRCAAIHPRHPFQRNVIMSCDGLISQGTRYETGEASFWRGLDAYPLPYTHITALYHTDPRK